MCEMKYDKGVLTAVLSGEIDHHAASDMRITIDGQAQRFKPRTLELDFSKVSFMDSSGVGLVMGRYRNMQMLGGKLRVVNVPERHLKMFRLSGLAHLGIFK